MGTRTKLMIAAIAATALLGMAVGAASANRLELPSFERGFRIAFTPLTLEVTEFAVRCPMTLEGTFAARTFAKTRGARIGGVNRQVINFAACTGGSFTILVEALPWGVTYQSFTGTLPRITGVTLDIIGMALNVNYSGFANCLFRTEVNQPLRLIGSVNESGRVTSFRADETIGIETRGGVFCTFLGRAHFRGTGTPTIQGSTTQIQLRLI